MYHHPGAMFGPLPHINHRDQTKPIHAIAYQAWRRDHGLPPWLKRNPDTWPTTSEINLAVDWWNQWITHAGD